MTKQAATHTFVTITCERDYNLLRLQARSLALYLPPELVSTIVIVDNSRPMMAPEHYLAITEEYRHLSRKVRYYHADDVAAIPNGTDGWLSQQILKLMVAAHIETERYVVLDAKNHCVFPVREEYFDVNGKMPSRLRSYETDVMRRYLESSLTYFGLSASDYIHSFVPTITPFILPTQVVRELISVVVRREARAFPVAFLDRGVSEFFLFAAYSAACGTLESLYDFSGVICPTIWESDLEHAAVSIKAKLARSERLSLPFFSVHRRALPRLNQEAASAVSIFWHKRGLFNTAADAATFIAGFSGA